LEINPSELPPNEVNQLMIGSVVPRPIAWVSTISEAGQPNLAPFSFFTAVCPSPPTVVFCPGVRGIDGGQKDTLHNIRVTGEYVINFVTEPLAEPMNITATELPPDVNEFERAGLTPAPSRVVQPPRVAESPIHFECRLREIIVISDEPGGGNLVIGTVVHMHFDESVNLAGNQVDIAAYQAIGRLGGASYCHVNDLFDLKRLPSEIKTGSVP
jgi:flavin reductase (DIM6/NTAB) family NADH-FMN oxidoreductase RutF